MFATRCYEIALENYKATNDIEGIKRIGDVNVRLGNFKKAVTIYRFILEHLGSERVAVLYYMEDELLTRRKERNKLFSFSTYQNLVK
ncbi:MAG: hypothetical protein ACE5KE_06620 [Methanosarcinales archaeon]